ncbi:nucleotide-binding oligomerization domain-containing protein 1-like [Halichoeres trimaculatus]|uniref:nucleotide-binding oligomerization domain-containing protein 1-like n=1 Tax=Halichoeres trimaculatus TaxID=147232 RepID=UPI003D9F74FF
MACTSQSALEYVRSARLHLVTHLRDLSVIVENLHQEEVFHGEEVSTIQAERNEFEKARKILDSVTKKGEEACYTFLRVIDRTWKRTSGRGSAHSETRTEASSETEKFNLSYWISCYPFREDAGNYEGLSAGPRSCQKYQERLKTRARKKSSEFWMRNKKLLDESYSPDLCYSPLVLVTQGRESASKIKKLKSKKSKMSRPKKLKTYIPVDKPNISPHELLKTNQNILLVGKPGIGKTALCHEMFKLWAEKENKELDYMFYFDMRQTSDFTERMSLEELLFRVCTEPDEGKEEVLADIKKFSDNVTVVFDGITDLSSSLVKSVVERDLLPNAKVIITCRPDDEDDFFSGDFLRVEVKGFSEQTIRNYFSVILGEDHKKVLCHLELFTLCHVPMYALMVAACFLSKTPEDSPQPCSMTEIYINIVRFCLHRSSNKTTRFLNSFIQEKKDKILSLAELAFHATKRKSVNLTDLPCEDSCVLCFLKPLVVKVAPTETRTTYAFLHYTVQEFFAALWLLKNPDQINGVFQQCLTEEGKHMKHLIPFMCRLLTEKSPSLLEHLVPAQELKSTSSWIFQEMRSTFCPDVDLLFFCQCLYESQCPAACVDFLETLDYHLDLSAESLDSYLCCAVANVVTMSKERKVRLNLEDVSVSEQGITRLIGCLDNVLWCDPLPQQMWRIVFLSEGQFNDASLLSCDGNQLNLPLQGRRELFERTANILQKNPTKVNVCLHWDSRATTVCPSLSESLLKALPCIRSLSFRINDTGPELQDKKERVRKLKETRKKLFLDLFWTINLSERKTSILLEVLKLQPEKKPVELLGCSYEESEVRTFLQCLPYISQLSCGPEFFQCACSSLSVRSREEAEQFVSLLQLLGFILTLTGELPSKTCKSVGRVLGLCGSEVDLILTPTKISVRGASLLFRHTTSLRSLRLSSDMALVLCGWVKRGRVNPLSVTEELSLSSQKHPPSERVVLRVVSSLASLLRSWTVRQLDLTESRTPAQSLIPLLLHDGPLTIKLSGEVSESLLAILCEIQDTDLTRSCLSKVGGDLTPVCLNWELLHHLLESSHQTVTVDLRKNSFLQESFTRLLPFLDRVLFKRLSPSFVLTAIREVHTARASSFIPA